MILVLGMSSQIAHQSSECPDQIGVSHSSHIGIVVWFFFYFLHIYLYKLFNTTVSFHVDRNLVIFMTISSDFGDYNCRIRNLWRALVQITIGLKRCWPQLSPQKDIETENWVWDPQLMAYCITSSKNCDNTRFLYLYMVFYMYFYGHAPVARFIGRAECQSQNLSCSWQPKLTLRPFQHHSERLFNQA